jgi:hypothetical protein
LVDARAAEGEESFSSETLFWLSGSVFGTEPLSLFPAAADEVCPDSERVSVLLEGKIPGMDSTLLRPPHRRPPEGRRHTRSNKKAKQATIIKATPPMTPPAITPGWDREDDAAPEKGAPPVDEGEDEDEDEVLTKRQEVSLPLETKNMGDKVESSPMVPSNAYHPWGTVTRDQIYWPDAGLRLEAT